MKMLEFKIMDQSDQINLLYKEGTYIGKRKKNNQDLVLYQLDSFYIEITYIEYRRFIQKIRCFSSTSLIDPYLEQINLASLV
ncbi:MAG: hypothetical protein NVS1B13_21300 [Flavisolibacter sp.]